MKSRNYSFNYRNDNFKGILLISLGKVNLHEKSKEGKASEDVEKLDRSYLAGGNTQCCRQRPAGKLFTASSRTKYTTTIRPVNRLLDIYPGE